MRNQKNERLEHSTKNKIGRVKKTEGSVKKLNYLSLEEYLSDLPEVIQLTESVINVIRNINTNSMEFSDSGKFPTKLIRCYIDKKNFVYLEIKKENNSLNFRINEYVQVNGKPVYEQT